jgi:glycosyltransferase involved in cell wall biosynthesis
MPDLPPLAPIASQPLSVVLLARNQAQHVEAILGGWVAYLNGLNRDYEVIVVDDASPDNTADAAERFAASSQRVRVLRKQRAQGEGKSLQVGVANARYPLLFYTHCNCFYQPADLGRLLHKRPDPNKAEREIDLVQIMSAARGGRPTPTFWRMLGMAWRTICRVVFAHAPERAPGWLGWKRHLAGTLVRIMFGIRYYDVGCPFRLLRREILQRIPLQSTGPFVHVELMAKANYLGLMMGEELPLEPGHYPPLEHEMIRQDYRTLFNDAWTVIRHPDFGPATIA